MPLFEIIFGMICAHSREALVLQVKAAAARYMLPVIIAMLQNFFNKASQHAQVRLQCLEALLNCYKLLDSGGLGVEPALAKQGRHFVLLYNQLNLEALEKEYADRPAVLNYLAQRARKCCMGMFVCMLGDCCFWKNKTKQREQKRATEPRHTHKYSVHTDTIMLCLHIGQIRAKAPGAVYTPYIACVAISLSQHVDVRSDA